MISFSHFFKIRETKIRTSFGNHPIPWQQVASYLFIPLFVQTIMTVIRGFALSLYPRTEYPARPFRTVRDKHATTKNNHTMADEKIIFSMVGVSKTFNNQKKSLTTFTFRFLRGENRHHRPQRLWKIDVDENHCRHRQELPGRSGLFAWLQRGLPRTGPETGRHENGQGSGAGGLCRHRRTAERIRGSERPLHGTDGRRRDGPAHRTAGRGSPKR